MSADFKLDWRDIKFKVLLGECEREEERVGWGEKETKKERKKEREEESQEERRKTDRRSLRSPLQQDRERLETAIMVLWTARTWQSRRCGPA